MQILIVSSSKLNPDETFYSTFELTQAKQLAQTYKVAILAVRVADDILGSGSRALLRRAVTAPTRVNLKPLGKLARNLAKHWCGVRCTNVYRIEGVPVYEAVSSRSVFERSFEAHLDVWIRAAFSAFKEYRAAHGNPDLVHAHGRFLNGGAFALKLKTMVGIPYIYTEHSSYYHRGIAPPGTKPILKRIIENAAGYSAVSPFLAESVSRYIGSPLREANILANVLDEIYQREPLRAPPSGAPFIFMNIATLYDHKGVDFLLKAFKEAFQGQHGYTLKLCGGGPREEELRRLASTLGMSEQVQFLGQLSKPEVLRHIDNAHTIVLSSRIETFGVALIEALARGRPVIATRCGGPTSIVKPSMGLLVDVDSVSQMAGALRRMATDAQKYDGAAIRNSALESYGADAFRKNVASMYGIALSDARRSGA